MVQMHVTLITDELLGWRGGLNQYELPGKAFYKRNQQ